MSFTLHDLGSERFEFSSNVWSWKAAVELIKSFDIISEGTVRQMGYNATGVKLDMTDAHAIGEKIRDEILPKLAPNKRLLSDLTVTDAPDDKTLYIDESDQWKNYSVTHDWLKDFAEFCLKTKGFQVF
ncbi:MAG: hypothetical protein WBD22_07195 [Pyrinomonadaceae bacterium]